MNNKKETPKSTKQPPESTQQPPANARNSPPVIARNEVTKQSINLNNPVVKDVLTPNNTTNQETNQETTNKPTFITLEEAIIAQLKTVYDPEIPVDIYALGLIYDIKISDEKEVHLQMTLTTPGCPVAQTFPETVRQAVLQVEEVVAAEVELVWDPPWTPERMNEAARLELGFFP